MRAIALRYVPAPGHAAKQHKQNVALSTITGFTLDVGKNIATMFFIGVKNDGSGFTPNQQVFDFYKLFFIEAG